MSDPTPLDATAGARPLSGFAAQADAARAIAGTVSHALDILLAPADLRIYAHADFADALRARLRDRRRLRVRLLVPDGLTRAPRGAVLWRFVQDFPTFAALRVLGAPLEEGEASWLIADRATLLYRRYPAGAHGEYDADAARRVRALRQRFEQLWTEAHPDPDSRRLSL